MTKNPNHFVIFKPKNNKYYYYYVYRYGRKKWRTTGEKTKAKALEVILARIADGDILGTEKQYMIFGKFAENFWDYDTCPIIQDKLKRGGHYTRKRAKTCASQLERFILPTFKNKIIADINASDVRKWLFDVPDKYNLENKTCNEILTTLRTMLDEAIIQGHITDNVARKVKPLVKGKTQRKGTLSTAELKSLIERKNWLDDFSRLACIISAYTGMRAGEVRALTMEQIHEDYIDVNASYSDDDGRKCTKSGWSRIAPISRNLYELIRRTAASDTGLLFTYNGIDPVSSSFFNRNLKKACENAKIDAKSRHISFHSFRYYMNTRLVAANIDGEKIRSIIGHESEEMTEHYLLLSPTDLQEIRAVQEAAIGF